MAERHAEEWHADALRHRLHERGLTHLDARKHGAKLIIESGPADDRVPYARLQRDTVHLWLLDIHGGRRWERTPFRATMDDLVETLATDLGWLLAPRE